MIKDATRLRDAKTLKLRAWRAADVGPESSWRYPLPAQCAGALLDLARELASGPRPLVETRLADSDRLAWSDDFAPVADALENGRGFAIVRGPSTEHLPLELRHALYWVVGQVLGEPVEQNVCPELPLHDAR